MPDTSTRPRAAAVAALVLAGLAGPVAAQEEDPSLIPCTGRYALCTSAPCVPVPGGLEIEVDGETGAAALCECAILFGDNVAFSSCDERDDGLLSTYSYAQTGALDLLTCDPQEAPEFANCLDAPCEVDPRDPAWALCTCPTAPAPRPWVTFGGGCDPAACKTTLWSGATAGAITAANCVLNEYMSLSEAVGKNPDTGAPACNGPYETCSDR